MSDLVKMIQEANRNERPHPLTTVHGPRAVQPIYAISKHELSELTDRVEALEAALREILERCDPDSETGADRGAVHAVALARAALKQD